MFSMRNAGNGVDGASFREVRAVVFDAAETLITTSPSRSSTFCDVLRRRGLERTSDDVNVAYKLAELHVSISELSSQSRRDQRLRLNVAVLRYLNLSIDGLAEELFEEFESMPRHWEAIDGARELFDQLWANGFRIGIGSNFNANCSQILSASALMPDFIVVSAICGYEKPSREFFAAVEDACQHPRQKCLFVGDSLRLDYLPSRAFGFKSVLFDQYSIFGDSFERITKLSDLLKIVNIYQ